MTVTADSPITIQTVSPQAALDKLAGTPLEPWTQVFIAMAESYRIDLNWVLSYLQWETGFGSAGPGGRHFSMEYNDPWDFLCGVPGGDCGPPLGEGAIDCHRAPNGYCYSVFPTMEVGIEAGYKNWVRYVNNGWSTWFTSLSVALCGNPSGCSGGWVNNVIRQGQENAERWPYVPPGDGNGGDGQLPPAISLALPILAGLALMAGSVLLLRKGGA